MGNVYNAGRDNNVVIVQQGRRGIGFFGFLCLVVLVFAFWKWILAVLVIAALVGAAYLVIKGFQPTVDESSADAIAARADAQHNAILDGNRDAGTYGQFPPAV